MQSRPPSIPSIEYGVDSLRANRRKLVRKLYIWSAIVIAPIAGLLIWYARFSGVEVCANTAELRHFTEWNIPFTNTTFWRSERVTDTRLSLVMKKHHLSVAAGHNWIFCSGSGNRVMCALGTGYHLAAPTQLPNVADFIDCACECKQSHFANGWLKIVLNPTGNTDDWRLIPTLPQPWPKTQNDFAAWWKAQSIPAPASIAPPTLDSDPVAQPVTP